jgi:nucleoid-associated protein EbfC
MYMKGFGGGAMGGMAGLMKQANQMQSKMKKLQEELATREFTGTSGGGAVTVKVNGDNKVLAMTINPEVMKAGDVEMLQDLVTAAVNDAIKTAKDESSKEMSKITGGMSIPGF